MGKPANSEHDDFDYNLNPDGKERLLNSNRKTGGMNDDIYTVDILEKKKQEESCKLYCKKTKTQEFLPLTTIKLNTDSFMTNEKGEFQFILEEDVNYKL